MTYILQESISGSPADDAGLLDLGSIMGQCHTFGAVAGRCSGAHPATLRGLRERCYLRVSANWRAFCNEYLKMSQTQANPIIQLWNEFGAAYFELAQLTRISPALSPTIYSGAVQCNGQAIELSVENSRRVAALVAELRHSLPATKPPHPISMSQRFSHWTSGARGSSRTSRRFPDKNSTATTGCGSPKFLMRWSAARRRIESENGLA